jgi:hypothetical protein
VNIVSSPPPPPPPLPLPPLTLALLLSRSLFVRSTCVVETFAGAPFRTAIRTRSSRASTSCAIRTWCSWLIFRIRLISSSSSHVCFCVVRFCSTRTHSHANTGIPPHPLRLLPLLCLYARSAGLVCLYSTRATLHHSALRLAEVFLSICDCGSPVLSNRNDGTRGT